MYSMGVFADYMPSCPNSSVVKISLLSKEKIQVVEAQRRRKIKDSQHYFYTCNFSINNLTEGKNFILETLT